MPHRRRRLPPLTRLWQLAWDDARLSCVVYKAEKGLEMRLETGTKTIFTEPFELGPRMLSRLQALRRSLKRRGWQELTE